MLYSCTHVATVGIKGLNIDDGDRQTSPVRRVTDLLKEQHSRNGLLDGHGTGRPQSAVGAVGGQHDDDHDGHEECQVGHSEHGQQELGH